MWQFMTPSCTRAAARRALVCCPRRHQPHCTLLEERCLLSVSLTDVAPAVPYVGSPVIWVASSKGHGSKPAYRFTAEPPGGPLQVVRDFSPSAIFTCTTLEQ